MKIKHYLTIITGMHFLALMPLISGECTQICDSNDNTAFGNGTIFYFATGRENLLGDLDRNRPKSTARPGTTRRQHAAENGYVEGLLPRQPI